MQWNKVKICFAIASTLVALTGLANANQNSQIRNLENRVTALEQRKGASGIVNPPANPNIRHGANLFLFGELLYWKATENGLPFAVVNKDSSMNLAEAKIKNLQGQWDVGVRTGIGYIVPHDGWDVNLSWLHFNTRSHKKSVHSNANKFVFPSLAHPADPIATNTFCRKAEGKWKLFLNQLDLDLGREFFVSKWLTLRPHGGIRTDWVKQKVKAEYNHFEGDGLPVPNETKVHYKDRWWGIGLESGLDSQWGLGEGWSIYADIAAAILYGFHTIKSQEKDKPPFEESTMHFSSLPNGKFMRVKEHLRIAHAILDLQLGLRWDWKFDHDRFHLGFQAGWENHIYFSQNQFPYFSTADNLGKFFANQGDLTLQGWTFGARFDF
jgi:hypothetical protein